MVDKENLEWQDNFPCDFCGKEIEKIRTKRSLKQETKRLHGNPYRQERKNKRRFG
tara:strand:+ start:231 stop:395 length:165 start_codon:yes stop_codon:yes gene_type:complete